ncbi:MAG: fluoride efflux transporter CrcB [Gemmatimonadetes bacterium]|nr:fluoride efflux transporter CrcB [Gemmatimonadota bacterium]
MRLVIYLALGGVLGTLARYGLQGLIQPQGGSFPWGTLVVNLLGSFALGFLMRYLLGSGIATPELRAAATIGFCGAFTTMSTFAYETVILVNGGEYGRAGWYLLASIGGNLTATAAGLLAARKLL